jgi:two-component system cell cycle sensor histidine kinase/response regulator CckA
MWLRIVLALILVTGIGGGLWFFRAQERSVRGNAKERLSAIAELKVKQLTSWRAERLGYSVLTAATPTEALALAEAHQQQIALLLTDVVMPEMTGRELALTLQEPSPGLRCLYMSGYTADVIAHRGVLDQEVEFIQKPFSRRDLAAKVREVLDRADRHLEGP